MEALTSKTGIEKWPDRIYLQRDYECAEEGCGPHNGDDGETTWCKDKIHSTDVEYVRADLSRASVEPSAGYTRSQVMQFLGWLTGDLSELHHTHPGKLQDSWERFCKRMEIEQPPEPPTDVQRDAERYRWLRDKHNNCNDTLCVMDDDGMIEDRAPGFANDDPIDLDRAIDAIRATATKEAAHAESICERCDKPLSTHSLPLNRCADGERGIF